MGRGGCKRPEKGSDVKQLGLAAVLVVVERGEKENVGGKQKNRGDEGQGPETGWTQ